jgi:MoxR-like ATPase
MQRYLAALVRSTRGAEGVRVGASPRASLALMKAAQALAMLDGVGFVTPEHVQELAEPVIAHRLVMDPHARFSGQTPQAVVREALARVPVPH